MVEKPVWVSARDIADTAMDDIDAIPNSRKRHCNKYYLQSSFFVPLLVVATKLLVHV